VADAVGQRSTRFVEWYSRSMRSKTSYLRNVANQIDGRKPKAVELDLKNQAGSPPPAYPLPPTSPLPQAPLQPTLQKPNGVPREGPARVLPPDLSGIQQVILTMVTSTVQTVQLLAYNAGYSYNEHFRLAIRQLVKRGLLVREGEGVRLPRES
jgi:hypothetical protein